MRVDHEEKVTEKLIMETVEEVKVENGEDIKPSTSGEVCYPNENKYSHIKNKQVRNEQFRKKKREQKKVLDKYIIVH